MSRTSFLEPPAILRLILLGPATVALLTAPALDSAGGLLALAVATPVGGLVLAKALGGDVRPLSFRFLFWSSVGVALGAIIFAGTVLILGPLAFAGLWLLINALRVGGKVLAVLGAAVFSWSVLATWIVPDRIIVWSVTCALVAFILLWGARAPRDAPRVMNVEAPESVAT